MRYVALEFICGPQSEEFVAKMFGNKDNMLAVFLTKLNNLLNSQREVDSETTVQHHEPFFSFTSIFHEKEDRSEEGNDR